MLVAARQISMHRWSLSRKRVSRIVCSVSRVRWQHLDLIELQLPLLFLIDLHLLCSIRSIGWNVLIRRHGSRGGASFRHLTEAGILGYRINWLLDGCYSTDLSCMNKVLLRLHRCISWHIDVMLRIVVFINRLIGVAYWPDITEGWIEDLWKSCCLASQETFIRW